MRNMNPKIVQIIDETQPLFKCKVCGGTWSPNIQEGGRLPRGAWQCPNGCKPEDAKEIGKEAVEQ